MVDDGSRDDTPVLLASFGERIRWERTPHLGGNAARNRLTRLAAGEWLQYLDADDLLDPEKVERDLDLATRRGADVVVGACRDQAGVVRHDPVYDDPWLNFLAAGMGVTSSNLFRRSLVEKAGGWDPARRAGQEQALMVALLREGARVAFAREPLCTKRRVNPHSAWRSVWRDDPATAVHSAVSVVGEAVRHLQETRRFGPAYRQAAGARFLGMARAAWRRGGPEWRVVLAEARALGLDREALLSEASSRYRMLHRTLGFEATERLESARVRLARGVRARGRRGVRWLRGRAAALARRAGVRR